MQIGGHDSRIYSSQQPLVPCPNCNRRFPTNNIQIHEAYCVRNFRKCQMCGMMIDKNSVDEHQRDVHSVKVCQFCGKECMGRELNMHIEKCMAKPEPCLYCAKPCPKGQLKNHQQACGARNKQCPTCKKMIMTRQFVQHQQRCQNRRSRRQNSQQQRLQPTQVQNQRLLVRQNSQNQLNIGPKRKQSVDQRQKQQKRQSRSKRNVIERQQIRPQVSPIPISIQITLQHKNIAGQQMHIKNSPQSSNNINGNMGHHSIPQNHSNPNININPTNNLNLNK